MFKFFSQIRLSRALITNSFLRETCTIYTICFLIPGLTKLLESNFQAVEDSMLSRGPSETSKVRGCFEFLTTSRGRIRALFFPPSPLLFLSSHFSLHRSLFQRHVSTSFLNNVLAEVFGAVVSVPSIARIFLRSSCHWYVVLTIFIGRFLVRNRLSLRSPSVSWVNL